VVVVEPVPVSSSDPLRCLSEAEFVEECRFVASSSPGAEETVLRDLADGDDEVVSLDLDGAVCPYLPICDPVIDGLVVFHDSNHITTRYGRTLLDPVDRLLEDEGVLSG